MTSADATDTTETLAPAEPRPTSPWLAAILCLALLATIAIRFAQPIEDGDVFWQMSYGSQIIDRHTLRTDHSIYSWMPASNDTIYCAWTGELLFLSLWKIFGLAGLFIARYAAILIVLALIAYLAKRLGVLARPEVWLIMLVMLLASMVGTVPKPTMLSFVLWNIFVFCGFQIFLSHEQGRNPLRWIYALPCLMVIWVNTHGLFMLAAPFVAVITACGFWMLPRRLAIHLLVAALLCGLATIVNPYGFHYPLQLISLGTGKTMRPDFALNNEYQPIWNSGGQYFHLPELGIWMLVLMLLACSYRQRGWLLVTLLCLAYAPLYLRYVRSSLLLPAIFAFGAVYLLRGTPLLPWLRWAACALFLILAGRTIYDAKDKPDSAGWLGFGISYRQPVDEAEFLAQHNFGPDLYNSYDVGGYLLWRLYPRYKVMVDARSFPFLGWIEERLEFSRTKDHEVFARFLDRHPANVAMVNFREQTMWREFLNTPRWRPVFYGPNGAVFLKTSDESLPIRVADSVRHLRNVNAGFYIFNFARAVGDYDAAWAVLDQMNGPLKYQLPDITLKVLQSFESYRQGQADLREGNYLQAWEDLGKSFAYSPVSGQDRKIMTILQELVEMRDLSPQRQAQLEAQLQPMQAPR